MLLRHLLLPNRRHKRSTRAILVGQQLQQNLNPLLSLLLPTPPQPNLIPLFLSPLYLSSIKRTTSSTIFSTFSLSLTLSLFRLWASRITSRTTHILTLQSLYRAYRCFLVLNSIYPTWKSASMFLAFRSARKVARNQGSFEFYCTACLGMAL